MYQFKPNFVHLLCVLKTPTGPITSGLHGDGRDPEANGALQTESVRIARFPLLLLLPSLFLSAALFAVSFLRDLNQSLHQIITELNLPH